MAEYNDDALYDMSDEELEAAFRAAKADYEPDTEYEDASEDTEEFYEEQEDIEQEDESADTEEEYMEQPDEQDSDDDTSSEDEEKDESDENTDENEKDDSDGNSDENENDTAEDEDDSESEEQPVQNLKFKANNKEYEFTNEEIMTQFPKIFGQAMDYTKKMQAIKPWRKTIDAIEEAKLSHDDINLMIDVLKGDKGAINEVIKRTGIDTLELDADENKYTPKDYGRDETALNIKDVVDEISADEEYATTHKVLSKDWDDRSWNEMSQNPELIKLLHIDVKNGMYAKVQPIAEKLKVYGRGAESDLEYYKKAAGIYFEQQAQEQSKVEAAELAKAKAEQKAAEQAKLETVKQQEVKRKQTKEVAKQRKAAAPTKSKAGTSKHTNYLDDSDEAFEEWYAKLQDM